MKKINFTFSTKNKKPIISDNGTILQLFSEKNKKNINVAKIFDFLQDNGFFYDEKNKCFFTYYYEYMNLEIKNRLDIIEKNINAFLKK